MKNESSFNSVLQTIDSNTTLNLSGKTEASSAEEQLARDNRIRLRRILVVTPGRPTASRSFSLMRNEYPEPPAMPPKTLGSGAKPQSKMQLNQKTEKSISR